MGAVVRVARSGKQNLICSTANSARHFTASESTVTVQKLETFNPIELLRSRVFTSLPHLANA